MLDQLRHHSNVKQIGSTSSDKSFYGTTFVNSLVIIPLRDTTKIVIDA